MSSDPTSPADPATPVARPVRPPADPPRPPKRRGGCLFPIVLVFLFVSLLANAVLFVLLAVSGGGDVFDTEHAHLAEKFYLGDKSATDKVAVVRVEGVISDSGIKFPVQQLEKAAADKKVKAVVLRVDSPGGTVTASDELYKTLVSVRDGTDRRFKTTGPKPVSVSMGGVAASGGYYIAAAGNPISAERTTITGSIGVFAALPNVAKFGKDHGITVELIRAGAVKAAGSFFHEMSPQERQTWQDTVDGAYDVFLGVVAEGRPKLTKEALRGEEVVRREIPKRDDKGDPILERGKPVTVTYTRVQADGGTYTAEEAKRVGLIDEVRDLPAAVRAAAAAAGLGEFRAVTYDRPPTVLDLFGGSVKQPAAPLDAEFVSRALTPKLWYLAPSADGGVLAP